MFSGSPVFSGYSRFFVFHDFLTFWMGKNRNFGEKNKLLVKMIFSGFFPGIPVFHDFLAFWIGKITV